ncbi:ABC transporter ATP-binding protein [Paenibacillus bovis]|uniref:Bacitracin ABC transporter ATP-binding protein n=1 Tax=Paenibacillus bovis TaxID=1616788 RepID=A0A172ZL96_9BACL|nr:ABC transporter ATP-binding protein [Paenibacillus bovis]ANF97910.1 bacitracin ABC transporter ATP-binding protein [Paenibacillus bovis]
MSEWIMETEGLTKTYRKFTPVDQLQLHVREGEVYGFLGPNGAGKTTTIRMLLGLIRPSTGSIRIFGRELPRHRSFILRQVGSMVESPSYYGHLTGKENLKLTCTLLQIPETEVDRVLDIVRLRQAQHKLARTYSLGMKQRLGIAQALLGNPRLLILDEPTNGLDPAGIQEIRELIVQLPRQYRITVFVSSHILREIERVANRVGIIHTGRLLFEGEMSELHRQGTPFVQLHAEPAQQTLDYLREWGYPVVQEDHGMNIMSDPAEASVINRRLVNRNIEVSHLSIGGQSLEDIFLEMTKGADSL